MQYKIKTVISSLAAEAAENKSKAVRTEQPLHCDLDISFLNPLFMHEQSSRWIDLQKKAIKLFSMVKNSVTPDWTQTQKFGSSRVSPNSCVIAVPHYSANDAVCNDTFMLRKCLRDLGMETHIFAQTCDKGLHKKLISSSKFKSLLRSPQTLLIYNHCVYWPSGSEYIASAQGPVWFRYHNVTPPEFFAPYDSISAYATRKGREQTEDLVKNFDSKIALYLPVSPFNLRELQSMGASVQKCEVLAPFHKLEEFASCSIHKNLQDELCDGKINILFVGRIVPNKGFEKLLATVHKYTQFYGPNVRLIFAGGLSANFKPYYKRLLKLVNEYRLSNIVRWTGKVSFEDLHTYYAFSHVFLLLSEHEGFCLPILEAQFHKIPILAVEGTALRDTMGEGQLCFPSFDPELLATAIHRVHEDKNLQEELVQTGLKNLEKYSIGHLKDRLAEIMRAHT